MIHGVTIPEITWGSPSPGHLIASAKGMQPASVKVWMADNPDARDFRVDTIGRSWKAKEVKAKDAAGLSYEVKVEGPEKGWRAFVLEFTFKHDKVPLPLKTTTGVYIIPDTLPHGEKAGSL